MKRMQMTLAALSLTALLTGCAATETEDEATTEQPAAAAEKGTAEKPGKEKAAAAENPADGDWELMSFKTKDSLGSFGGTARIKYNGDDDNASNIFTITLLKKGTEDVLATLTGAANDVAAGKTSTVELLSTDKFSKSKYDLEFQTAI